MVKRKALNVINEEISDSHEISASANSSSANEATDTSLAMLEKRKRLTTSNFELSQIADQDMTTRSNSDETLTVILKK